MYTKNHKLRTLLMDIAMLAAALMIFSMMFFENELVNRPYKGGRQCSDIVYFGETN